MRPISFLLLAVACVPPTMSSTATEKSVFALAPQDFQNQQSVSVTNQSNVTDVEKGDILYITATGTLTTSNLGVVGPDGSAGWGGSTYVLVNRPVYALFGRINQSVFFIGRETVVIAPETGPLELLVNTCTTQNRDAGTSGGSNCTATGAFAAIVYSKLASGVTLATTPPLTDNTATHTTPVSVSAGSSWQTSGVQLAKGQKVFISATGTLSAGADTFDADGSAANGGLSFQLVNRFVYRLYGRVGDALIDLGKQSAFLSPAAGELELIVNHRGDATGTLSVDVGEGVVPARGLFQTETDAFAQSTTMSVLADGTAQATGLNVHQGDPIVVTATGTVNGSVGPWGQGPVGGTSYALTNRPINALFGRVGSESFFLGGEMAILAPATGPLELLINSCGAGCGAQGSFSATVRAP